MLNSRLDSRLDSGSPCLVPIRTRKNVTPLVSLYRCLLVSVYLPQEADVIVFDFAGFEGFPD